MQLAIAHDNLMEDINHASSRAYSTSYTSGSMADPSSSAASVSLSPSVTGESSKRRSPVWKFFEFNETTGKSVCQVGEEPCAVTIPGKFPTNLNNT